MEIPRLVAIETTNRCNARCAFCPNSALQRDRQRMSDELFEKVVEDCRAFPLAAIEPFLNGEPFVDPQIMPRLELIRRRLPRTRLRLYTNGYALKPSKIDELPGLGVDHLYVSLNTIDEAAYRATMGLDLRRTLDNLAYLTDPVRRRRVARRITFRMTRSDDTPLAEQRRFAEYCARRGVACFIVARFNYAGAIPAHLPVPGFPCEHTDRLDVLCDGTVALCCMDHDGRYPWGAVREASVLEVHNSAAARRYRDAHRRGRRGEIAPCSTCNVFWPRFTGTGLLRGRFMLEAAYYFLRHRPTGIRPPLPGTTTTDDAA